MSSRSRTRVKVATGLALLGVAAGGFGFASTSASRETSAPHVTVRSFHSNALRGTEHLAVYTPRGYTGNHRRYPVIYFLHGLPGTATSFDGQRIRRLGRSVERAGKPALVVAIQGARKGDTDPEWHDWGRGRDWETAAAAESVRFVDRNYRTIANRDGRALIGLSAGGYGAGIIGFHHPATYSVVEAWSGYFHPTTPSGDGPKSVGDADADRRASVHSYVRRAGAIYRRHPTYFAFFVGDHDTRFRAENEQLDRELKRFGVPHVFAVYRGTHSGGFWDRHEDAWVATALAHLAAAR